MKTTWYGKPLPSNVIQTEEQYDAMIGEKRIGHKEIRLLMLLEVEQRALGEHTQADHTASVRWEYATNPRRES